MKTQSAKAKGRRRQQFVVPGLLDSFQCLGEDDVRSTAMGQSGDDVQLSVRARELIPYAFECKNQERLNIWSAIDQNEKRIRPGDTSGVVFKKNHSAVYAVLPFDHFLHLARRLPDASKVGPECGAEERAGSKRRRLIQEIRERIDHLETLSDEPEPASSS
jgi:hypothetical protein